MRSASRDSMAYQQQYEERFPVEREQARQLRVAPTPRRRKRAGIRPSVLGCVMVLAITAVYILFCQMQLTELSAEVGEQNDRLNELSAENVSLTMEECMGKATLVLAGEIEKLMEMCGCAGKAF